jgi:hypothetical protein
VKLNKQLDDAFTVYPDIVQIIAEQQSSSADFCAYLDWAYISGSPLIGDRAAYYNLRTDACALYQRQTLSLVDAVN